jgi:cytochrome P450
MMLRFLLVASYKATTNRIGKGLLALFRHAQQLHMLREEPELTKPTTEEFLRYDSPVQGDASASEPQDRLADPTWRAARAQPPSERRRCGC